MERRSMLQTLLALFTLPMLTKRAYGAEKTTTPDFPPLSKSEPEWKALLEPARFQILFEEGTERPFSSPLNDEKHAGTFICAACFLPLFDSEHKFDSGTGWPSFTQPIEGHMATKRDFKLVLPRTEYHCARCEGHQGHVFNDGPAPRGERWCNNGLALLFVAKGTALPNLRS
jgi:peptide-methionine (R)-S-oxide reductase